MSPSQPWSLTFRQSRSLLRRQKQSRNALYGRQLSDGAGSRQSSSRKTAHYLAVLKYSEKRLRKLSHPSKRKVEANTFADIFAAGNLLSASENSKTGKANVVGRCHPIWSLYLFDR